MSGGRRRGLRILVIAVAAVVLVVVLFTLVFPRIARLQDDPALGTVTAHDA